MSSQSVAVRCGGTQAGETDSEAVARETLEEVGLDLRTPGHYSMLGEVKQRVVNTGARGKLVVCCHVFEQHMRSDPAALQQSEVAACGWAPLSALTDDTHLRLLDWSKRSGADTQWDGFPSVALPMDVRHKLWVAGAAAGEGGGGGASLKSKAEAAAAFDLWGLTLGIVNDLLHTCRLRSSPIDKASVAAAAAGRQQQAAQPAAKL